nr:hypothetical protein [Pseudonocardia sp. TRM90224]
MSIMSSTCLSDQGLHRELGRRARLLTGLLVGRVAAAVVDEIGDDERLGIGDIDDENALATPGGVWISGPYRGKSCDDS